MNSEQKLYQCKQWLMKAYIDDDMTLDEIADICQVDRTTIHYFLKEFGIPRRKACRRQLGAIQPIFNIPRILYEKLKETAKREKVSQSEIGRRALWEYLYKGKLNGRSSNQEEISQG